MRKMELPRTLLVVILALSFASVIAHATTASEVEKELICACGCEMVVYDCYCDLAKEWKASIEADVDAGKSKKEILAGFVAVYGDQVLATPKKTGLELTIWALPVVASVLGTVVIYRYASGKAPLRIEDIGYPIRDETERDLDGSFEAHTLKYENLLYDEYKKARREQEKESDSKRR
jgi:cytochrome c-type biogenesis protein CcmH